MNNLTIPQKAEAVQQEFNHKYQVLEKQRDQVLNTQQSQVSFWKKEAETEILKIEAAANNNELILPLGFNTKEELIIAINNRLMSHMFKLESEVNKRINNINAMQNQLKIELETFLTRLAMEASKQNMTLVLMPASTPVAVAVPNIDESEGVYNGQVANYDMGSPPAAFALDMSVNDVNDVNDAKNNTDNTDNTDVLDITDMGHESSNASNTCTLEDKETAKSKEIKKDEFVCECNYTLEKELEGEFTDLGHSMKLECDLWQINHKLSKMEKYTVYSNDLPTMAHDTKVQLIKECEIISKKFSHISHIVARSRTHAVSSLLKEKEIDNSRWRPKIDNNNINNNIGKSVYDDGNHCNNGDSDEKMEEEIRIRLENARKEFAKENGNKKFPYARFIQIKSDVYNKYGKQFGSRFRKTNKFDSKNNNHSNRDCFADRALNLNNNNNNNNNGNNSDAMVAAVELAINEKSNNNSNINNNNNNTVPDFEDMFD